MFRSSLISRPVGRLAFLAVTSLALAGCKGRSGTKKIIAQPSAQVTAGASATVPKVVSRAIELNGPIPIERVGQAISHGEAIVVIDYVRGRGDLEARTHNDWTPLMLASLYGKNFIGLFLLESGADCKALHLYEGGGSVTPIEFAVSNSSKTGILVDQLIKRGCLPQDSEARQELLKAALDHGNFDAAKLLIMNGAEMDRSMWLAASSTGSKMSYGFEAGPFVRELKAFLQQYEADKAKTRQSEMARYQYDARKVVEQVVSAIGKDGRVAGAALDQPGLHPVARELLREVAADAGKRAAELGKLSQNDRLVRLASGGDCAAVRTLLESGQFSEAALLNAVYYATQENQADMVKLLLASPKVKKIDLNQDPAGHNIPPLHRAAYNGLTDIAILLLGAGADPDFVAKTGDTAVSYAAYAGNRAMVELLLEHDGDPGKALEILRRDSLTADNAVQVASYSKGIQMLREIRRTRTGHK